MKKVYFSLEDDIVNPCWDNVFKAMFTKETPDSRGALSKFLSAVINEDAAVISITANEPPADDLRGRQIRYDITCKFNDGRAANVEMTVSPDKCELIRMEYYEARLFSSHDMRGTEKTYDSLPHTYQISIIVERPVVDDDVIIHHFRYYDAESRISLNGRTHIITLELSKLARLAEKSARDMTTLERWASFLLYTADKGKRRLVNEILEIEEGVSMAGAVLLTISKDEVERARLESEYKYTVDYQSKMITARQEGVAIGEARGEARGAELAYRAAIKGGASCEILEQIAKASGINSERADKIRSEETR